MLQIPMDYHCLFISARLRYWAVVGNQLHVHICSQCYSQASVLFYPGNIHSFLYFNYHSPQELHHFIFIFSIEQMTVPLGRTCSNPQTVHSQVPNRRPLHHPVDQQVPNGEGYRPSPSFLRRSKYSARGTIFLG